MAGHQCLTENARRRNRCRIIAYRAGDHIDYGLTHVGEARMRGRSAKVTTYVRDPARVSEIPRTSALRTTHVN